MASETTTTSKAWTFTTTSYPSTLQQTTLQVPSTPPTPTSIILKPHAVSLNPVDIQLMNLPMNNFPNLPFLNTFTGPKTAGRDFSGTILSAGPSTPFSPGDEVMGINMSIPGTGFLSERVMLDLTPTSGANLIHKPTHLSHIQAASLPCVYLTARTTIEKVTPSLTATKVSDNKLVVLGGSSSTGIYSIKLAKARGWTVLSTCSSRNTDFVKSLGADIVVDYTSSPSAVVSAVRSFAPHAIIDCVGGTETIGLARRYVTIVGDKTSRDAMGGPALYLTRPRMVLRWLMGWLGVGVWYDCVVLENRREWLEEVKDLREDEVVIDGVFGFGEVKQAFERLDTGRARGKVVVRVVED